jgi:hypothetical protein
MLSWQVEICSLIGVTSDAWCYFILSHNITFHTFITRFHKNDMNLQNSFMNMQIRKVSHSFVWHKENSIHSFKTLNNDDKRHYFVADVGSRAFCVFYEVKIVQASSHGDIIDDITITKWKIPATFWLWNRKWIKICISSNYRCVRNRILHLCMWHMKFMEWVTKAREISNLVTHFINFICYMHSFKILYLLCLSLMCLL